MEQKSPATYIGLGITIGVLIAVILIYVLGIQPQSVSIGIVDFPLPSTQDSNTGVNLPTVYPTTMTSGLPECKIGNNTGIAGQVLAESGEPISGANITSEPPTESVISDSNGYYLICNIPAEGSGRQYIVNARKYGYADTQLTVSAMGYSTIVANIIMKSSP